MEDNSLTDFYKILGIKENANKDEIKKAYRTLQMKYHPDRNPGNQDAHIMTQKINEAYETLGDENKRKEYDFMRNNPNPFMRMPGMHSSGNNMEMHFNDLNDIINMMFGGSPFSGNGMGAFGPNIQVFHSGPNGIHQFMNKPNPIIKSLEITMENVLNGALLPLEIERWILENNNKTFEKEIIYVDIPQGIDDNEIIILREKGNIINHQIKGDIKVNIIIRNNTIFKRSGLDLIFDKTISLKEALCGFKFDINYINGKNYLLNNSEGNIIPPGYKKIYPNMGLKRGEHTGSMIINFIIQFPDKLSLEQINKLNEIL
jgi:DnaJ-class molecular chaperone